ncbi:OmpA family protein [Actibacterium sp. 188UL27-1]|uniref:OmpA family protein n=1 Tax=Actibacterium sp. 188UL27-1 TaxID=2786961 RepID=UPI001EF497CE|nr:OmpA family protein [Actibacterium sp. 188UL27-1]
MTPLGSYQLPTGAFAGDKVPAVRVEGEVQRQAWQMAAPGVTTLQILAPLRAQLVDLDFDILFECEARRCGGFDFRYATQVMAEPDMHVDLGDYRFLSAQRGTGKTAEFVSLMVSRSSAKGFVQLTRVGPALPGDEKVVTSTKNPDATAPIPTAPTRSIVIGNDKPLINALEQSGRAVLNDLTFNTGSADLGQQDFASLDLLATYLLANPKRSIVLVGHTDAEGSLAGNIALSKKRASSVSQRLVDSFGVPSDQVKAEGVGFLAPLTTNLTEAGRTQNRRVEVILSSTE